MNSIKIHCCKSTWDWDISTSRSLKINNFRYFQKNDSFRLSRSEDPSYDLSDGTWLYSWIKKFYQSRCFCHVFTSSSYFFPFTSLSSADIWMLPFVIQISLTYESTKFAIYVGLFRVLLESSRNLSLIHLTEWILNLIQSGCIDWSRHPTRPSLIIACRSKVLLERRSLTRSWSLSNSDRSTWIFTIPFELKVFFLIFRSSNVSASTPFSSFKFFFPGIIVWCDDHSKLYHFTTLSFYSSDAQLQGDQSVQNFVIVVQIVRSHCSVSSSVENLSRYFDL